MSALVGLILPTEDLFVSFHLLSKYLILIPYFAFVSEWHCPRKLNNYATSSSSLPFRS